MSIFNERRRSRVAVWVLAAWMAACGVATQAAEPVFSQDFSKATVGKVPEGFLILDGLFEVKEEGADRWMELPGVPLESYGVMFGAGNKENWGAQARMTGTGQGRRYPVFGVSINGVSGYRIQVAPAKRAIELLKGDEPQVTAPFIWESGTWTQVRVQVRKVGERAWKVEGKAWKDGTQEPAAWMISWDETEALIGGRAAVWGKPFSGTPIRFDDLKILPVDK